MNNQNNALSIDMIINITMIGSSSITIILLLLLLSLLLLLLLFAVNIAVPP